MDCESFDRSEPYHSVNCKRNHSLYSKTCEKWLIEKGIQTVHTKLYVSYPETEKTVDSWTSIVGVTYAVLTAKTVQKLCKTTAVQMDNLMTNN